MAEETFIEDDSSELSHYGILRRSGRYPWGSGGNEYSRALTFQSMIKELRDKGVPQTEMAAALGLDPEVFNSTHLRETTSLAREVVVQEQTHRIKQLRFGVKQMSTDAIAKELGIPEPTVRSRLKESDNTFQKSLKATADVLRKEVESHGIVDVGKGVNISMNISPEKMRAAMAILKDEGYETYNLQVRQVGGKHMTNQKVLVPPGTTFGQAARMKDNIHTMGVRSEDGGLTFFGIHPPMSISSKRLMVKFDEDGGTLEDGVVYVRPGVKDLDMGKNSYAQVRIAIDGTHYIKGMAVIKPDLPDGVDLVFNSNKSREVGKLGALKPLKDDPDNPFGTVIKRQIVDVDPTTGKERLKSAINLVNEEGDWDSWRNSLPSQMLAKQPHKLIKEQLEVTREQTRARLDEINSITNPVVRKKKLEDFAEQIDADAVDLRAAAMPRQATKVIIPMTHLNKNEIYAPTFESGEKVVLVRYPHGGQFEIPEVTVNNNGRKSKSMLGNAFDAIGIHPSVAEKLSGADFDGDTVVVIPNRAGKIKGSKSMGNAAKVFEDNLKGFDAKRLYGDYKVVGTKVNKKTGEVEEVGNFKLMKNTGMEMGMITNLITDMSIQGARPEHIVRAVKHSMVVIDAEKHKLNYRQSYQDNNIAQLKELYQGSANSGAKTLLSRATADVHIDERKLRSAREGGPIDPKTGEKVWVETGATKNKYDPKTRTYMDGKDGRPLVLEKKTSTAKQLSLHKDAFDLTRDRNDPVEKLYAEHANSMKALANNTRLSASKVVMPKQNRRAKEVYRDEVADLDRQLKAAIATAPLKRRADIIAGVTVKARRKEDPSLRLDRDRLKKVERQAKTEAYARLGISQPKITISDRQWDAIQAGGVSSSKLREILVYADPKRVEELALPKKNTVMTSAVSSRAKAMLATGASTADVARSLGISASTLKAAMQRGEV